MVLIAFVLVGGVFVLTFVFVQVVLLVTVEGVYMEQFFFQVYWQFEDLYGTWVIINLIHFPESPWRCARVEHGVQAFDVGHSTGV